MVNKCDVVGHGEAGGEMISSAVENKGCVRARCDVTAYFFEMHGHDLVLAVGATRAAVAPRCGQTAPKM
jgi:hypothetical protein